jgi:hypothetical protein
MRGYGRTGLIVLALSIVYIAGFILVTLRHIRTQVLLISVIIAGAFFYVVVLGLFWWVYRSTQEYQAALRLFFTICFLEEKASEWPCSRFRWQVARRLEGVARRVEQIPLASRSLTPSVKQEAFRLSRSKAQAIRKLELWAIRPAAFTFTDLLQQLTSDLGVIVENRWYDLPEEEGFKTERPRWLYVLQISGGILIIGAAIFLTAFAAKIGPAASILTLILFAVAIGLLNSAGISTGVIDRYIQTGSKVMSGK